MVERYTFNEIKSFQIGTVFYTMGHEYKVNSNPIIQESDFYGELQQKIEFDAYCEETSRERHFSIADVEKPYGDETFTIYKTATSHSIEGSSPLQPRADTETFGIIDNSKEWRKL